VFVALVAVVIAVIILSTITLIVGVVARKGTIAFDPTTLPQLINEMALSMDGLLLGIGVSSFVLASVSLLGARLSPTSTAARLRLGPSRSGNGPLAVLAVGIVSTSFATGALTSVLDLQRDGILEKISDAIRNSSGARLALAFALIGFVGPIGEELFFRGYLQTRFRERWGVWPAILITAAAFGLFHMDLAQGIAAATLGVYMGWAVERTGSIRPAIVAHIANNVVATGLSVLVSASEKETSDDTAVLVILAVVGAVIGGGAAWVFHRSQQAPPASSAEAHGS
jgi:membrane protease YdiL (CAAX protease family)